ncbi:pentapeptide repeat-containing protein [Nocardia sp. NBC_01377]|uniref:pentapeptide repeat-containing protein n=1 Tax=Nocardia sp. NBC_01377 TaxID=2903595 RepID=UPI0032449431
MPEGQDSPARADTEGAQPAAVRGRGARAVAAFFGWSGWTTVTALATAVAAFGALWFTGQTLRATNGQLGLQHQIAVTDRLQKAVEQLSSESIDTRLAGIYLLERLAKDSPTDHEPVFAILSAYVRTHTDLTRCPRSEPDPRTFRATPPPTDIQAVLTVIGRRKSGHDLPYGIDLRNTCLTGADLAKADLTHVQLTGANLAQANLYEADLSDSFVMNADLTGASLIGARAHDTVLLRAVLSEANLFDADFEGAVLREADLRGARLSDATLKLADIAGADLRGTDLRSTDLTAVVTISTTGVPLRYDDTTLWPPNFPPPPR